MKTVFEIVKSKTSSLNLTDEQIQDAVDEVGQEIFNYLNLVEGEMIPEALGYTWANMAVELLNSRYSVSHTDPNANPFVESIDEGDTSVTFKQAKATMSHTQAIDLLSNYTAQLNKFRRLKW